VGAANRRRAEPQRGTSGAQPPGISERLGHATIAITLDTYSHAIPAMQEEAAALIAGLVFAETAASGSA
jgi:integrase